ncbi:hypothetical protein GGR57DRAFT_487380 [Xylariaceae sp. FL1272]|nr:hypothetical protein GGR57DRAFT_487380 [Xylariaceae sp. FL1272]
MSKIEKLNIKGIRSFNHLNTQTIKFFAPLTLIVGHNGCGKTTIIECLKYATTGDQPPNSKGGAFVHDPKLSGDSVVKAQVKLLFSEPPDTTHTVTRSMEVQMKKTARNLKTIDSTLHSANPDEPNGKPLKGSDINEAVPARLGASRAIIDAVIFCHQEESLWPMSEPASLKARFDKIFEVSKYTDAINNIKKVRKAKGDEHKVLIVVEAGLKKEKAHAEKLARESQQLQVEINGLKEKLEEIQQKMELQEQQKVDRQKKANDALNIVNRLAQKQDELGYRQTQLREYNQRMVKQLSASDDTLRRDLEQYEERVAQFSQDIEECRRQHQESADDLEDSRVHLNEKLSEHGRLESDKQRYERQVQLRLDHVHQAAREHTIRGFEGDLDDRKVQAFYERLQKLHGDKVREFANLKDENASEYNNQTAAITDLNGRKSTCGRDRSYAAQKITSSEQVIASRRRELGSIDVDDGAKALLDSEAQDIETQLRQATDSIQAADFDNKLQEEHAQLQQLETENSRLSDELAESTQIVADREALKHQQRDLSRKQQKFDTLKSHCNDKISSLIGRDWDPKTVERRFEELLGVRRQAYDVALRQVDEQNRVRLEKEGQLKSMSTKAQQRDSEIARCKNAIVGVLRQVAPESTFSLDALAQEISRVEEEIKILDSDAKTASELHDYFLGCQKALDEKNKCGLCERLFTTPHEKSSLAKKLKKALGEFDSAQLEADLHERRQDLSQLQKVQGENEIYSRLIKEKPTAEDEKRQIGEQIAGLTRDLEEKDDQARSKREDREEFESLGATVREIAHAHKDLEEAQILVDQTESKQQQSGPVVRSTSEISEAMRQCGEQLKVVKAKIAKLTKDQQRLRDTINRLELARSELKNKISHAIRQLERRRDIQDQIHAEKEEIVKSKETMQKADKDLEAVDIEIAKARQIREDAQQRARTKEDKVAKERDDIASSMKQLKMTDNDVREYLDRGGPSILKENENTIQTIQSTIRRIGQTLEDIKIRSEKMQKELANTDSEKRNIQDNLDYRNAAREVNSLKEIIDELKSRRAQDDYDRFAKEAESFLRAYNHLSAENTSTYEIIKLKDNQLGEKTREWDENFKDAENKYRETHIKCQTLKAAIEDLGRYAAALNHAVIKYHAVKMGEVNDMIAELWTKTYQGTDIDRITITSDADPTGGRSTYNYRVVMTKNDVEMDMRGRCSAGQKVLASIIIRLALAESFGIGCGIIALDEPTTNLDRDNIKALAQSLKGIVEHRRTQRNFQLVVITHDADFLREMQCSDFTDDYWYVERDSFQNSRIVRKNIGTL